MVSDAERLSPIGASASSVCTVSGKWVKTFLALEKSTVLSVRIARRPLWKNMSSTNLPTNPGSLALSTPSPAIREDQSRGPNSKVFSPVLTRAWGMVGGSKSVGTPGATLSCQKPLAAELLTYST